jgi:mono/diheme cytochrome c family protein
MKNFIKIQLMLVAFIVSGMSLAFINYDQPPWEVPAEYKAMKNPVKKTNETIAEGKKLYDLNCASCHGATGKGDGKKSEHLAKLPADLSLENIQQDGDGNYFYMVKIGRSGLHSYKNKLDDQEIWTILHFVHTFKK